MGTNPSIWDRALQSLSPDVQKIINSTRTKKRDVLQAVLDEAEAKRALSLRKRWKFTRSNGEVVIVRDLLEKIVSWIQRFKETGDTMVQYDPTHAALPWAAVRFLLQMAVSEVQVFAAMADDLENISRMLVRYRVFEGLYLRGSQSEAELKLEDALTRLYAEILSHLAAAVQFYDERSVTRILKSPFRTVDDTRAKALVEREKEVDAFASLSDAETLRSLEAAFTRLTTQSSQSLSEERFNQILEWLTVAPYYHHHQFITQSRLPSAGKWLLKHPSFMNWRLSSSSSLLLLHGIPGSGKSTLCSVVIDSLLPVSSTNQAVTPAPLAYFYCANPRSEKSRSSADDIMRTILFQLAIDSSHRTKMRDFLCSEYERQTALARAGKMDMAKLRVKDCVRLMLELAELDPLTIVLDGLDSVEDSERPDLIGAFEELVKKADNVVKVFVSSRTTSRSAAKPTHEFEIQTSSQETRADMEAFIDHLVNKAVTSKLLLDGRPCPDTREMLKQALVNGAGEMFLWAKLQLERVCRETVEEDIVAVLKDKLPHGINALYQESLNHMLNSGEVARDIAVRVLSCILYMRDPLTPGALLAALAAGKHSTLVLPQVLAICANFVVLDSNCNVLRVAHQSVQDFLMRHETFDPAIANNMLASMCIDACSRGMNSASGTGKALEIPSEDFYMLLDKGADPNLDITTSQFPLMAAAGNGDLGIVKSLISSGAAVNVRGKDHWRQEHASPLHAAAAGNYLDVVILLLSFGTAIDSCGETFGALLELAARYGHLKVLRYLLSAGDRVGAEAAVNSAVRNNHVEIMQELLAVEAPIPTTVLATACRLGHLKMIEFLLERVIDIENSQDALDEAFEVADDSCMKLLLSYTSCTAAQFLNACAIGSVATIKGILNEGKVYANQSAGKSGDFPLQVAALHLRLDVVKLLISHEAKIDCESGKHGSPLISVLESYSAPILGAKVDKTNQDDMQAVLAKLCLPKFMSPKKLPYFFGDLVERPAPTSFLRFSDCMEILKTLVAHGASVTGIERPLGSPIHIACALGDKTMVLYLTENGASIDETSGHFEKVIFAAIYGRNTSIVSLILDNAVVPTHIHGRYGTALHYACALGDGPITRMLLEHGADDDVRDHQGRTVVAIALKSHNNVELRHKQWDPSVKRVETPLEVLAKLVKLRICDEDLAAVSADAGFSASSTLSLLLSLDEDYRDVICRLLSMTVSFDTIDLLKERSRSVGTKETVLPTAYPDVTITTDDLRLQSSITSIKRLLDFDRELCIAEAVVLQALKLGHRHPTRWGNDHGTLESLFQRDSRLRVTQTMLREARCETDMEILLEHLDSKMKISDEVVDSISRLDTNEKLPILRLLTQFDAGIRFSPRVVLRCIEKSFQALDTLAMLLKHDPSIFITPSIFLRVFETKCFDMDAHRSKLVELLHTHGKRVFFTNEIKTATENVFRLESQKTQRQRLFSLQTLDESYCDPEVEGPEEDETATPPTATS
ncbi:hypothetical protein CkaCkLH20_10582 [Colletotrichum karsti]|uniref:Uncharacterized protein n=1 Tax=Colletotrichum karsti TaxID=1095194 RepID=A0A9P6LGU6_9PEZI|nr:uncharacterized protein CkaCkLH20_10582 [Colletotrichum karsti]KAF9871950.1 hypothetical protein CkaCkLH20_10582 [Colletotrichum karsti]